MASLKKQILESLKNNYCRLKASKLHGIGVVAIKDIPKGTELFKGTPQRQWAKLKISELKGINKETKEMVQGFFAADPDGGYWICSGGLNSIDISFYLNHSDKANVKAIINQDTDFVSHFVTARKIKKGEELMVCYDVLDACFKGGF